MGTIILLILFLLSTIIIYKIKEKWSQDPGIFWTWYASWIICLIIFLGILFGTSLYSVDEGEGMILLQFGRVYDTESEAGLHLKRSWADTVEWRTRLKAINERIEARTNDDMKVTIDLTIWWAVQPDKLHDLYSNVAKNYEILENGFVVPGIRSAVRDEIAKVDYRELNSNREKYALSITKYVAEQLVKKFIIIDKVNIKNVIPPSTVNDAIEQKLQAKQQMEKKEFELETAKKEADIKREEAKGIRDSQAIIQQRLTPLYVQWYAVEMMKSLAKSENTTFIFAPTSMKGIGLPVIYGSQVSSK